MDEEDCDPNNWRSAVDPTSGRSYWYHRLTRESTWIMPECLNPALAGDVHDKDEHIDFLDDTDETATNARESLEIDLITTMVNEVTQTGSKQTRLRCLWSLWDLSIRIKSEVGVMFHVNQSWTSLCGQLHLWHDSESVLLLAAVLCNLSVGRSTLFLVSASMKEVMLRRLDDIFSTAAQFELSAFMAVNYTGGDVHCPQHLNVLSEQVIGSFGALVVCGHELPAMLLLVFVQQAIRTTRCEKCCCWRVGDTQLTTFLTGRSTALCLTLW